MQIRSIAIFSILGASVWAGARNEPLRHGKIADGRERLLYVTDNSGISVYDINDGHKLLRKIDVPEGGKKEVPHYQMLLGGTQHEFGVQIQSIPARLAPVAVERVIAHYKQNRQEGETFRAYVLRHRVETFRTLLADLQKPPIDVPEMFRDWGDEVEYSLKLGRGECAA